MEETTAVSKVSVTKLNPKSYRKWITEIKGYATDAKVWRCIDSDTKTPMPEIPRYLKVGNFTIVVPASANGQASREPATRFDQPSETQRQSYRFESESYKHEERQATKVENEVRKMRAIILESARTHISDFKFSAPARDLITLLQNRFKRNYNTLIEAIHEKYEELKDKTPAREKLEHMDCPMGEP